jgi:hypothetical protein
MDTGTFSMIIIGVLIIIGGYLILTDAVEGRAKMILIVVIAILTIMLILNTGLFSGHKTILDSPVVASNKILPLLGKSYKYTSSYSLSTWIYVNDWNTNNGKDKEIISRTLNGKSNPRIYLDAYENRVNVQFGTGTDSPGQFTSKTIQIDNLNTQKWVNITCCFSNTNVDTYINGKLVDTTLPGKNLYFPKITEGDGQLNFNICANNTYSGFISNTNYYDYVVTPQEAWNIYNKGFSSNMLGNLLNKYNAKFTFYNNQTEVTHFTIM